MSFISKLLALEETRSNDKKRKSCLPNFINFFLIIFFSIAVLIRFLGEIFFKSSSQDDFFVLFLIIAFFSMMTFLVEKGFVRFIAFSMIILLLFSSLKEGFTWGIDLYTIDIIYPFIILMSALLINVKKLAKQLKLQNENLERLVEERTKQLKILQLNQLTRIAPLLDLGKLSAGLVHDIREPLSVLSFILQNAKQNKNIITNINQAFLAIDKIDDLSKISACKLFSKPELEIFNLNLEIKKLISLFEYKSRLKKVKIVFETSKEFELQADRSKLNQVLANLILNALEAYDNSENNEKFIFIKLIKKPRNLLIKIKDYGVGISQEDLIHIFEPNFSSKDSEKSLGFGLYVGKEVMKKVFESEIKVESKIGVGSTFTLFIKNKLILNEFRKKH